MNTYTVEIEVESYEIEAHNANDAYQQAHRIVDHSEFHVWEVTEDDKV